jgi:hypothetical protein
VTPKGNGTLRRHSALLPVVAIMTRGAKDERDRLLWTAHTPTATL